MIITIAASKNQKQQYTSHNNTMTQQEAQAIYQTRVPTYSNQYPNRIQNGVTNVLNTSGSAVRKNINPMQNNDQSYVNQQQPTQYYDYEYQQYNSNITPFNGETAYVENGARDTNNGVEYSNQQTPAANATGMSTFKKIVAISGASLVGTGAALGTVKLIEKQPKTNDKNNKQSVTEQESSP